MIKKLFLTLVFSFICLFAYADTVTYYFNAYDVDGEEWLESPENMVDGNTGTKAGSIGYSTQLLTGNTCEGTNLGTISKVELRIYAQVGNIYNNVYLRPVFGGSSDGDNHDTGELRREWSAYLDITSDTNAPSWTWTVIQNLDCDVEDYASGMLDSAFASKVEIRVTYGGAARRRIIMVE